MTPPQPRGLPACELCGGRRVGNLQLAGQVGLHPAGRVVWANALSGLSAVSCLDCGHTEFFATQLHRLRSEAEKHPEQFRW
ncbi:hypothetical protein [Nocardia sp. NPDC003963]